jgi:hypothetical protein
VHIFHRLKLFVLISADTLPCNGLSDVSIIQDWDSIITGIVNLNGWSTIGSSFVLRKCVHSSNVFVLGNVFIPQTRPRTFFCTRHFNCLGDFLLHLGVAFDVFETTTNSTCLLNLYIK